MTEKKPAKRIQKSQPGDIYEIPIDDKTKAYMQFLMLDATQFNGDVMRVFEKKYPIHEDVDLGEVAKGKVAFHVYVYVKYGVKFGLFMKVGNVELGAFDPPSFRSDKSMEPYYPGYVSDEWYVWRAGEEDRKIGKLTPEYKKLDVGGIFPPADVIYRLKHGKSEFVEAD